MIWITTKFWPWLKKYWKWVLFPVGILMAIGAAIVGSKVIDEVEPDQKKLDDADDKRDQRIAEADAERDAKLQELAEKHQARLEEISGDQEKELEELTEKPIEEVVAWFDNL
jgi:hypothetical protein